MGVKRPLLPYLFPTSPSTPAQFSGRSATLKSHPPSMDCMLCGQCVVGRSLGSHISASFISERRPE